MKKLLFIALAVMMVGCKGNVIQTDYYVDNNCIVFTADSCEYIGWINDGCFAHKGNCKYCQERRKQEMRELINELKGGE